MALANASDAQVFVDPNTVPIQDSDDASEQLDAERIIRSYLYGRVSTTTMDAWSSGPITDVPGLIRSVAGRLVASLRLQRDTSGEAEEVNPLARALYNQAIAILNGIVRGDFVIDSGGTTVLLDGSQQLEDDSFYPNEDSNDNRGLDGPKFIMGEVL